MQDYGFRLYSPAIGKFLSVDPLRGDYPELTCYQFASNTPIMAIDLDGLEAMILIEPTPINIVVIPNAKLVQDDVDDGHRKKYLFGIAYQSAYKTDARFFKKLANDKKDNFFAIEIQDIDDLATQLEKLQADLQAQAAPDTYIEMHVKNMIIDFHGFSNRFMIGETEIKDKVLYNNTGVLADMERIGAFTDGSTQVLLGNCNAADREANLELFSEKLNDAVIYAHEDYCMSFGLLFGRQYPSFAHKFGRKYAYGRNNSHTEYGKPGLRDDTDTWKAVQHGQPTIFRKGVRFDRKGNINSGKVPKP